MKKFLLTLADAFIAFTASAQVYVGGEVGFWRNWTAGANTTTAKILPEVGYGLSEKWAIGTQIGWVYNYNEGVKVNAFVVAPYARFTYAKFDAVSLFLDGGFEFGTYKASGDGIHDDSHNSWGIGIKPGVKVDLTSKLSFVAHAGFFGYRDNDDAEIFGGNGFGLDVNGNNLQFGLYYNF